LSGDSVASFSGPVGVRHPDLAQLVVAEERRRFPVIDNLLPVVGQLVRRDGEVALRDARLGFRRGDDLPQMRLFEVLVVCVHVVPGFFVRLFVGRLCVGCAEVDRGAVRRPRRLADRARVRRQLTCLAAFDRQQVQLRELVIAALRGEGDRPAVRRPARRVLAFGAVGELNGLPARQRYAPDVRDAASGLPVGFAARKQHIAAVGRQLRITDARDAQHVDDAERARRLRIHQRRRSDGQNGRDDEETSADASHRANLRRHLQLNGLGTILPRI
jgi:hypothetical protein